jgi:5-guanidino-2-oxopentanoate decarboxylase
MSITVGRFLVELLQANDIDTVFGIPGVHTLELYRGLAATDLRHILVRHEQGAGFAADGYARISGRAAVAFVISGPGVTNILTAVAQAHSDSVPLLVIASTPAQASLGKQWGVLHELANQRDLAANVFGVARSARTAADVRDHLRVCLAALRAGRPRPAYLEIPLDLLAEPTDLRAARFASPAFSPRPAPAQVEAAIRLLARAERPLIITGGGARGASAELGELVDLLDAFLVTTAAGKGVLAEAHPANLGASLPYPQTQALAASADVVLAVGTEIAETDLYTGLRLPLAGQMIRIDIDATKLVDHYGADVALWGDARGTLQTINRGLARRSGWRAAVGGAAATRAAIDASFSPAARVQSSVIGAIRGALPPDGVVFSDMTQIAYLGNYAYPVDAPGRWFHPSGYGTLGFALPAALGATIAAPSRAVLALVGDFGLQFTLGELMSAVEQGVSLPIVVWNNGALGQIRDDMVAAGIPPIGVVGRNPDFLALAAAYGAAGMRVRDLAALREGIEGALGRSGPTLIEIVPTDFSTTATMTTATTTSRTSA